LAIRILIADDHGVLRAGLRALLKTEPDLDVIGEASGGYQALVLAARLQPDVVLLDISMPDLDGLEVTRQLAQEQPQVRVLLLTIHEDEAILREAIRAGAAGYIVKRAVESELINAIRSTAAGDMYIHPTLARTLLEDIARPPAAGSAPGNLTAREREVLRAIAQGYTNRQIAECLHLSVRTVETHRANLRSKLDIRSRAGLVRYAAEHGLIDRRTGVSGPTPRASHALREPQ
jgi:two-component system response regulator NreC